MRLSPKVYLLRHADFVSQFMSHYAILGLPKTSWDTIKGDLFETSHFGGYAKNPEVK